MKVAIINTYDLTGGAAKAAYRLNKGLNLIGINSRMLTRKKISNDPQVVQIEPNLSEDNLITQEIFSDIQINYINNNRTAISNTFFTLPYPGVSLIDHPAIKDADVINLHWVAEFLSFESINELLNLGKPVVWTLHDQWPFTGGCHVIAGCEKFKTDCKNCPQLNDDPYNLPSVVLANKMKLLQESNLYIVSPSQWLAGLAKESKVFKNRDVRAIPNAIEDDIYFPVDKSGAKRELGISDNIFTFYFGAHNAGDKNKGFNYLIDSIDYCLKNREFGNLVSNGQVMGVFAGHPNSDLEKLGVPYKSYGFIESGNELARLYNASDLLLLPSLEENFPNLILEAFACSTPVVAFKTGGIPELVDDYETGRIVALRDIEAFGDAILELVFNRDLRREMGRKGREKVLENYILEKQAHKYQSLFEEALSEKTFNKDKVQDLRKPARTISFFNETYDQRIFPLYTKYSKRVIQRKNKIIKKSEESVRQFENSISEKKRIIQLKDQTLKQKDKLISEIYNSYSWKIGWGVTRVLRFFFFWRRKNYE